LSVLSPGLTPRLTVAHEDYVAPLFLADQEEFLE
jgi:hypothetical protein